MDLEQFIIYKIKNNEISKFNKNISYISNS